MPPGPKGYPLLGNVLQTNFHNIVESLTKWTEEFGEIFKINLLGQEIVVVRYLKLFTTHILSPRENNRSNIADLPDCLSSKNRMAFIVVKITAISFL